MTRLKKLKILHLLSQRPDSTGSGVYVQAMIREAEACGYDNYLVGAGVRSDFCEGPDYTGPHKRDKMLRCVPEQTGGAISPRCHCRSIASYYLSRD